MAVIFFLILDLSVPLVRNGKTKEICLPKFFISINLKLEFLLLKKLRRAKSKN